ncbi:hypothetical protein OAN22_00435 [Alphaproteobacteria bacterium]|nr:hypothetical protein [Alphaproteobacteria bacterium]
MSKKVLLAVLFLCGTTVVQAGNFGAVEEDFPYVQTSAAACGGGVNGPDPLKQEVARVAGLAAFLKMSDSSYILSCIALSSTRAPVFFPSASAAPPVVTFPPIAPPTSLAPKASKEDDPSGEECLHSEGDAR